MTTSTLPQRLPSDKLRLLVALLVVSTALFIVGVAVERGWGSGGAAAAPHETSEAPAAQADTEGAPTEAQEGAAAREAQEHAGAAEMQVAGFDLESPWVVAAVVLAALLLIMALVRVGYPIVVLVLLFAALATLADIREIVVQGANARTAIALLAGVVALSHLATALVALRVLHQRRGATPAPTTVA